MQKMTVRTLWRHQPKTECHVHLEGAIGAGFLRDLHRRHRLEWAGWEIGRIRSALRFHDFAGFLTAFRSVCSSIRSEEDYRPLVRAFFRRCRREGIVHVEFFWTPMAAARFGLDPARCLEHILRESAVCGESFGVEWALLLDGVRQFPPDAFRETVDLALALRGQGVAGVGIGGDENASPLEPFRPDLERAREAGLRIHLHTGETGSAESMRRDLETARPHRVGHGIRAAESRVVQELLLAQGTVLDICLRSNRATRACPKGVRHPLGTLLEAGLPVCLGTDDPALFGATLPGEYARAARLLGGDRGLLPVLKSDLLNPLLGQGVRDILETRNARLQELWGDLRP